MPISFASMDTAAGVPIFRYDLSRQSPGPSAGTEAAPRETVATDRWVPSTTVVGAGDAAYPRSSLFGLAARGGWAPADWQAGRTSPLESDQDMTELATVRSLQARDQHVRRHERQHEIALGTMAGMTFYLTQRGPDGKDYATGAVMQVRIREPLSEYDEQQLARTLRAAAGAVGDPSHVDASMAGYANMLDGFLG